MSLFPKELTMWIGLGIFLIVVGAILEWAVTVRIPGVGRETLGWILMIGGLLAIILSFVLQSQRNRLHTVHDERIVQTTQRTDVPPPPA